MDDFSLQSERDKMLWKTSEMFYMLLIGMVIGFFIGVIV
jgi:nitrate reductase gamma subunit